MNIKHKFNKDKLWFTSDTHFFHENIIKYCNRPFNNADAMNDMLIIYWNDLVKEDDDIIIGGDFIHTGNLTLIKNLLDTLNGVKWLVMGNHDYQNKFDRSIINDWFKGRIFDSMDFKVEDSELEDGFMKFHVNHFPCEYWTRGAVHLHGHIHSGPLSTGNEVLLFKPTRYDMGCDNNLYRPKSYEGIKITITKQLLRNEKSN
jgi:calcineurin-like phosphoesterase family protein